MVLNYVTYSVAIFAIALYVIPSSLNPVIWTEPFELPALEGALKENKILTFTRKVSSNDITAPESLAIDKEGGQTFASLSDGRVVLLDTSGKWIADIYFNSQINTQFQSNETTLNHLRWCKKEARSGNLAWDVANEKLCGRPLGLRLVYYANRKTLYLLDAYSGLYSIDFENDDLSSPTNIQHLVNSDSKISEPSRNLSSDSNSHRQIKFFNDLDVSDDGLIYFTDSSYLYHRSQNRQELLDAAPRGRFLVYDTKKKSLSVLVCGLHFPNGVQIQPSGGNKHVLVVESMRFRILRINVDELKRSNKLIESCDEYGSLWKELHHPSSSVVSVFLDRAPGFMDNIRLLQDSSDRSRYLVGIGKLNPDILAYIHVHFTGAKSTKPFSLLWWASQYAWPRIIIGKLIPMKFVEKLVPKYGLVILVDDTGTIVDSLQDPTGAVSTISEAQRNPVTGDLWLGSHSNPYIGILDKDHINKLNG